MQELLGLKDSNQVTLVDRVGAKATTTVEALILPECRFVGRSLGSLRLRRRYGVYPLAVHRRSQNIGRKLDEVVVRVGDTLLLEGAPDDIRRLAADMDLMDLSETEHQPDRLAHAQVGVLGDPVVPDLHIADGDAEEELAPARLLAQRLERALAQDRQLHLAHGALHAEQQAVVRQARIVERRPRRPGGSRRARRTRAGCASRARCAPAATPPPPARCRRAPRRSPAAAVRSRAGRRRRRSGRGRRRSPRAAPSRAVAPDPRARTAAGGSRGCAAAGPASTAARRRRPGGRDGQARSWSSPASRSPASVRGSVSAASSSSVAISGISVARIVGASVGPGSISARKSPCRASLRSPHASLLRPCRRARIGPRRALGGDRGAPSARSADDPHRHRGRCWRAHPRRDLRQRPVGLPDDHHPGSAKPMTSNDRYSLAAARVERIVDRRLATRISGSMRLVPLEQENRTSPPRSASPR